MKEFITFDKQLLADWQDAFKLNHHWGEKIPSIIAATLALKILNPVTPTGCYMAKQKLEVQNLPSLGQELILHGDIAKKLTSFICCTKVNYPEKTAISLLTVLVKPETEPVLNNLKASDAAYSHNNAGYWRTFTRTEVNDFARLSGDTNSIHRGDSPVVQGMLILLFLEDYLASNNLFFNNVDIYYLKPVGIDIPVKLCKEDKTLYGIVGDSVCFKLIFQGE